MPTKEKPFTWKGKTFEGYEEIINTALKLKDEEQAQFVEAFCARGPYARQNIGYMAGYYDHKTAARIYQVFQTAHPFFGTKHPTGKEAFEMGRKMGEAVKAKRKK